MSLAVSLAALALAPVLTPAPVYADVRDTYFESINRRLLNGEIIHLKNVLRMGQETNGRRVQSILVTARSETVRDNGQVSLLVNGRSVDLGRRIGDRLETILLQPELTRDVLGQDIHSLELQARGRIFVQSVSVQLERGYGGGTPGYGQGEVIMERMFQQHQGRSILHVKKLLNLNRFRGREIEEVILRASSNRGNGRAGLVVNKMQMGIEHRIATFDEEIILPISMVRAEIGRDIRSLQIELQGNVTVTAVGVRLRDGYGTSPGYPGQPDRPGMDRRNIVSVRVNQHHSGDSMIAVKQMLGLNRNFDGRELESVEVVMTAAQGSGQGRLLVDGRAEGGTQSIGNQLRTHIFRLSGVNNRLGTDIRNLKLELRGRVYVESITARLRPVGLR